MTQEEGRKLKPGDPVRLNEQALPWTHGKVFYVDRVRTWGITCWTDTATPDEAHLAVGTGHAFYSCSFGEIEGSVTA